MNQHSNIIRPKRILVTGAGGQLGKELRSASILIPEIHADFYGRDALDITDAEGVRKTLESVCYDYIVNCAAYTAVDKAESDIENCFAVNLKGVTNLCEALKDTDCRLIHISTDFVFDGLKHSPYLESDETNPLSVYGQSKLEGEKVILSTIPSSSIIIRTGWLYSAVGHNFMQTILRKASEGVSLKVVDDQIGTPTWASDLARIILKIVLHPEFYPGVYHYSNVGETSWYGFAREIISLARLNAQISPCTSLEYKTPARRPAYSVLDKLKISETYGVALPDWRDSLASCIASLNFNID